MGNIYPVYPRHDNFSPFKTNKTEIFTSLPKEYQYQLDSKIENKETFLNAPGGAMI